MNPRNDGSELSPCPPSLGGVAALAERRGMLFVLISVALLLRIGAAFAVDHQATAMGQSFLIEGDANGYWELGQRIASGRPYGLYSPRRKILRVPGFPLLLAASIRVFGDSILAARIVLAFIGASCCWLTWMLGRRLFNPAIGFLATCFVAVHPLHIGNSVLILSETWFTFWLLLTLLLQQRLHQLKGPGLLPLMAFGCGAMVGATVLVRPGFLPWLLVTSASMFFVRSGSLQLPSSKRLLTAFLVMVGCFAVMLPWAVRNQSATGHLVFTSLWSGPSMYDGLNPDADGTSDMQFFEDDNVMKTMSEFEMNRHYRDRAVKFAVENPVRSVELASQKATLYLSPVPNFVRKRGWVGSVVCGGFWLLLVLGCFAGAFRASMNRELLMLTAGPFLLFLLVHMVFVGSVRYRLPVEFPLAVLAASGWWRLCSDRSSEQPSSRSL